MRIAFIFLLTMLPQRKGNSDYEITSVVQAGHYPDFESIRIVKLPPPAESSDPVKICV